MKAPPGLGMEYLSGALLAEIWTQLDDWARREAQAFEGGTDAWLQARNPLWRLVGRVTFHLAENRGSARIPFRIPRDLHSSIVFES